MAGSQEYFLTNGPSTGRAFDCFALRAIHFGAIFDWSVKNGEVSLK